MAKNWYPVIDDSTCKECGITAKANDNLTIDFLYLDTTVCERCQGTEKNLQEALQELAPVLNTLGVDFTLNSIEVLSAVQAEELHFLSSPTVRINGKDICPDVEENNCSSCGDLCGDSVDCRIFTYKGEQYNAPPKAMIVNSILQALYLPAKKEAMDISYTLPENLRQFFAGKSQQQSACNCGGSCC